jgi:CheY-like chemotaxis protein
MPEPVLIIDDEHAIAQLTSLWVKTMGFRYIMAFDGPSGLKAAEAHHPCLILLDVRMPGMDGFEVNARLKETSDLATIPVVFLSAHAPEATRQMALANGAAAFLSKPYNAKDLVVAAANALGRSRTNRFDGDNSRPHLTVEPAGLNQ